jgi:hypothetical protein
MFPAWLQALGFRDESWHNDASGRALYALPDQVRLSVWVGEEDPEAREWPEFRYHVSVEFSEGNGEEIALYLGDDAALVTTIVRAVLAAHGVVIHGG